MEWIEATISEHYGFKEWWLVGGNNRVECKVNFHDTKPPIYSAFYRGDGAGDWLTLDDAKAAAESLMDATQAR